MKLIYFEILLFTLVILFISANQSKLTENQILDNNLEVNMLVNQNQQNIIYGRKYF